MKGSQFALIIKWLAGFGISILIIWGVTGVATDNYYPEVWAEELKRNVPAPGWSLHNRIEGWARTDFGELGLTGIENIRASKEPKVLIWGDSFVEAAQVPDERKMHRSLAAMLKADGGPSFECVAVGHPWWSIADYYYHIPQYESAIEGCKLHVIHLFSLEDVYPDRNPDHRVSLFLSQPDLHFEKYDNEFSETETPAKINPLKNTVFGAHLQFFLRMKKQVTQIARLEGLRFSVETQSTKPPAAAGGIKDWNDLMRPDWVDEEAPMDAWRFALTSLQQVTDVPILFVYAPATPALDGGKAVEENPESDLAEEFGEVCREFGYGFVSLEKSFLRHWKESGEFHRGFPTSRPGEGHYNAKGHRLVAEGIRDWIRKNSHVVHAD